jgi:hypothetical protein
VSSVTVSAGAVTVWITMALTVDAEKVTSSVIVIAAGVAVKVEGGSVTRDRCGR